MIEYATPATSPRRLREGFALIAVLYVLVISALTIAGLFSVRRSVARTAHAMTTGAQLLGEAEGAAYGALAIWDGDMRERQGLGTTTHGSSADRGMAVDVYVTRLGVRMFSIVADARTRTGVARRVELLVRVPFRDPVLAVALVSAVNVSVGAGVRFTSDTGLCGNGSAAIALSPSATLAIDSAVSATERPSVSADAAASDSATYLRIADAWWSDATQAADVQLPRNAHVTLAPSADRAPVIYAAGDLTIDGGVGQGVLLVDGHLVIAGPFTFSGQIVVRHGLETRADNITISGRVVAWRARVDTTATDTAPNEVMLTHLTTVRYSRCDARHGVASWLQPRRVRARAFAELF